MTYGKRNQLELGLRRILDAAVQIQTYLKGLGKADFLEDRRTQDAVSMNILVIGETAARLLAQFSQELEASYGDIAWKAMRGMRNRMVHGYEGTDFELVWDTASTYIPDLIAKLRNKGI